MKPILIVCAPYYTDISDMLTAGAIGALKAAQVESEILHVPGAFEIPVAIAVAASSGKYGGFIALGCVIRGETTHYDIIANESARGLMDLAVRERLAIGNGILTCETTDQAIARANPTRGDKGGEAAVACLSIMTMKERMGV